MYSLTSFFYAGGAAVAFMMANVAMKYAGQLPMLVIAGLVFVFAVVGVYFQIEALRSIKLGSGVAIILAGEILLSAVAAYFLFSERYTPVEIAGMLLLLGGIGLLMHGGNDHAMAAKPMGDVITVGSAD